MEYLFNMVAAALYFLLSCTPEYTRMDGSIPAPRRIFVVSVQQKTATGHADGGFFCYRLRHSYRA
jgi:hypothetical protein